MNNIPKKVNDAMNEDPFYKTCSARKYHHCAGRITREHALYYRGKQVQMKGAIIPLCAKGHGVDQYQGADDVPKDMREWIALNLIDETTARREMPRFDWDKRRAILNKKYGVYERK